MKKIAMIFPGQGSQSLGMIKDLYDKHRIVQEYFEQASNCLEQNFVRLCFAASDKELQETVNAQTSIFLVSAAVFSLLKDKYGIQPDIVVGHSSGEYAALFAAGGMSFVDGLYLLKKRASFMEQVTNQFPGSMIAVFGISYEALQEICARYDDQSSDTHVAEIVNYNSPTQLVVSGSLILLDKIAQEVKALGGKVIPLNVGGAFHSRLMKQAAEQFALYMIKVDFNDLHTPLISNVDAQKIHASEDIKQRLEKQMYSHVQWWPSMQQLKDYDVIIEIAPGDKLSKLLKREFPDKQIVAINTSQDVEHLLQILGKEVKKQEHQENCEQEDCALEELVVDTEEQEQSVAECAPEKLVVDTEKQGQPGTDQESSIEKKEKEDQEALSCKPDEKA